MPPVEEPTLTWLCSMVGFGAFLLLVGDLLLYGPRETTRRTRRGRRQSPVTHAHRGHQGTGLRPALARALARASRSRAHH